MIGILVGLLISWVLLFLIEGKDIRSLGFLPVGTRLKHLSISFITTGFLAQSVCISDASERLVHACRETYGGQERCHTDIEI